MDLEKFIRTVPDFPIKGINFYDITTLFDNKITFNYIIQLLSKRYKSKGLDKIVAIEARGFIIGSCISLELGLPFIPIRKKGKLPHATIEESYELEYGKATIEIHSDAINSNDNVCALFYDHQKKIQLRIYGEIYIVTSKSEIEERWKNSRN